MQNEEKKLYPILFTPIYKEVIWGGKMLESHLHRKMTETKVPVGESWEIVDREDEVSIIENGHLAGTTLRELLEKCGRDIIGQKYNGGKFPLLVKIIDAGQRLSLQVHPDEAACKRIPDAEPKTEMWYIIAADKGAKIFAGLNHRSTKIAFMDTYQDTAVENSLQISKSVPGDAYFINAGTVHAIGAGNLLLEIQQNSDTTYRISDWGRVGADGKPRELHIEKAMDCIHFRERTSPKISGVVGTATHNRKFPIVKNSSYFRVDDLRLAENWNDTTNNTAGHIITTINNPIIISKDDISVKVETARNCLIPAAFGSYQIVVEPEKETTVIKTII